MAYQDQLGALAQLQAEEGQASRTAEVTVEQLEEARPAIDVVSVQNRYNLTDREHDTILDHCLGQ